MTQARAATHAMWVQDKNVKKGAVARNELRSHCSNVLGAIYEPMISEVAA